MVHIRREMVASDKCSIHSRKWLMALCNNNVEDVEKLLKKVNDKTELFDTPLTCFGSPINVKNLPKFTKLMEIPVFTSWATAIVYGSHGVVARLHHYDIDVFQTDHLNNSAIHSLIYAAYADLDNETSYVKTIEYLKTLLGLDTFSRYLKMENNDGCRPVELAAHLGTIGIFLSLWHTDDIYMVREERQGIQTLQYFDVTEYENKSLLDQRKNGSFCHPMNCLVHIETDHLHREESIDAIESAFILSWLRAKFFCTLPFIIIYFIIHFACIFFTLYTVMKPILVDVSGQDEMSSNNTTTTNACSSRENVNKIHLYIITSITIFSYIIDIVESIVSLKKKPSWYCKSPKGTKRVIVSYSFYISHRFFHAIFIGVLLFVHHSNQQESLLYLFTFCLSLSYVFTLFYYLRLIPVIGHYIIAIQHMIKDFGYFAIIFILVILPYVCAFMGLSTSVRCEKLFRDLPMSAYGTFNVMLNMVKIDQFESKAPTVLYIIHIFFVFNIGINLINFLIAIFSDTYGEVSANRHIMRFVEILDIITCFEEKFHRWFPAIHRAIQRRVWVHEDEKIYLTCLIIKPEIRQKGLIQKKSISRKKSVMRHFNL